jgi:hypothetical protein
LFLFMDKMIIYGDICPVGNFGFQPVWSPVRNVFRRIGKSLWAKNEMKIASYRIDKTAAPPEGPDAR